MVKTKLQDIARVCKVDVSTASRAMRDDPRVKDSTRKKVHAAAQRLAYRANLSARNLAGGRTQIVWLIIPSLDAPIDHSIVLNASIQARERGYSLFAALHGCDAFFDLARQNVEHYERTLRQAGQGLADGAIILPRRHTSDTELLRDLVLQRLPLVFIDNFVEELPVPVVTTDNAGAAAELVRRSVAAGAREAILLFEEPNPIARARRTGAQTALLELGVPLADSGRTPTALPTRAATQITAILGSSQYDIRQFVHRNGERLAGRKLVFGVFDDWGGGIEPAETVVVAVQDGKTMAMRAVDRLLAQIERQPPPASRFDLVPALQYDVKAK